ncbi:hypothetical protein TNCV_1597291 [Trichonephila clavipes]|nr:hypothetical protein TNCV_1597291 [Trichonephila clavipes]
MYHTQFPDRRCWITEFFIGYNFNFVKHIRSTSPDTMLVEKELYTVPNLGESILNVVVTRPESSTRALAHHVIVSYQPVCRVLNKNRLYLFHFQ